MKYDNKTIPEIAIQYARLRVSLEMLKDVKKDKEGAVLGYISAHIAEAEEALEFLQKTNRRMQGKLRLNDLELELSGFRNTTVRL